MLNEWMRANFFDPVVVVNGKGLGTVSFRKKRVLLGSMNAGTDILFHSITDLAEGYS